MNYKYAFIFLMTFLIVFAITKLLKENIKIQRWFSKKTSIHFNQRSLDFGSVPSKKAAQAYFVFTNTGSSNLKIENIDTRCGCTVTDWPTTAIRPTRKTVFSFSMTRKKKGFFLKRFMFFQIPKRARFAEYQRNRCFYKPILIDSAVDFFYFEFIIFKIR
jgi:hypothetical protein